MPRYFIGIMPPEETAAALRSAQQRAQNLARVHYGKLDVTISHGFSPLHITLVEPFELEDERAAERAVLETVRELEPFMLELSGLGHFAPHTVFATVRQSDWPKLGALRDALMERLPALDLPERTFRPHLSLARKFPEADFDTIRRCLIEAAGRQSAQQPVAAFPQEFEVRALTLFIQNDGVWSALDSERATRREGAA